VSALAAALPMPSPAEARAHPVLWAMRASKGAWQPARHLWFLADYLLKFASGEIKRLAISFPPQHGKTWLTSRYFPGWLLGRNPTARILQCSYGQELTLESTGACRDSIAQSGPEVFGIDTWARARAGSWDAFRNGYRTGGNVRGVGKGGTVGGRPADYAILDDLVKDRAEAMNPRLRQALWEWLEAVVFPRAMRLLLIATRWHHDDPIGRLEAKQAAGEIGEPWVFVNVPAVAEPGVVDPLGREPGEGLWPERYPGDWYERKRIDVGSYVWSALYQGRPSPLGGGAFRREWFRYFDHLGDHVLIGHAGERVALADLRKFGTCDLSTSKRSAGDWTVVQAWGQHPDGRLFLLDQIRDHVPAAQLVQAIRQLVDRWNLGSVYVERAGYQLDALAMIQACQKAHLPVREIHPEGDKITRAMPATAMVEAGRVLFPRGARWLPVLEDELTSFPIGHDDQVDALAYAVIQGTLFRRLSGNRRVVTSEDLGRDSYTIGR
jgi:predicted phage terminase large subunit-like protein